VIFIKLETKRLILRKPKEKDIKDLAEGMNNLNIAKHLSKVPYLYTEKDASEYINIVKKKKDNTSFTI